MFKNILGSNESKTLFENLEKRIFNFPGLKDKFSLSHYLAGILVLGASRSGKTSAVLKFIVKQWFNAGFGGLFTTTRVNDVSMIREWANECGRGDDVVVFDDQSSFSLSMFDYEMTRKDSGGQSTRQMVDNMMRIHELISRFKSGGSSSNNEEAFWKNECETLTEMSIILARLGGIDLSWKNLRQLAMDGFNEDDLDRYLNLWSVLRNEKEDSSVWQDAWSEYQQWSEQNIFLRSFDTANEREDLNSDELDDMRLMGDYWLRSFPELPEKTKSIVLAIFFAITRPFESSGILKKHFSHGVSHDIHPDRTLFDNKIIIIGFSTRKYGVSGIIATALTKLIFQQAWESRDLNEEGPSAKPVMLFMDEFQTIINPNFDTDYMSTAGGSLIANVVSSQNMDNIIMGMAAQSPESRAKSLCGNLNTKIFCANSNYSTNKWASQMIGQHLTDTTSTRVSLESGTSQTYGQLLRDKVPPDHFMTLKTGRKENNFEVQTIIIQTGRKWSSERNFEEVTFHQ